jgi:hypothetical protein
MKHIKILIIIAPMIYSPLKAEDKVPLIPLPMPDTVQKSFGIDKLTEGEKNRLAIWLHDRDFTVWKTGYGAAQRKIDPSELSKAKTEPRKYLHPSTPETIKEKIEGGKILELSDGSQWLIDPASLETTRFWLASQTVRPINKQADNFTHILINNDMFEAVKASNLKIHNEAEQGDAPKPLPPRAPEAG